MKKVLKSFSVGGRHIAQLECGHDVQGVRWPVPLELACPECEPPSWVTDEGRESRFADKKAAFEAATTSSDPILLDEVAKDRRWWSVQAAVAQNPAAAPETLWWLQLEPVGHIQVLAAMCRRGRFDPYVPEKVLRDERQKRATAQWRRDGRQNIGGNAYGTIASPHD